MTEQSSKDFSVTKTARNAIFIAGDVCHDMVVAFEVVLSKMERSLAHSSKANLIIITVHSPGGDTHCGLGIADRIRCSPLPVRTIISGEVCSAATFIALAATEKCCMRKHAFMNIHALSAGTEGTYQIMQEEMNNYRKTMHMISNFYLQSRPCVSSSTISNLLVRDIILTPDTCLMLQLIDRICQ